MTLRWDSTFGKDSLMLWSGEVIVGNVVTRLDGTIKWQVNGVFTKFIVKGYGNAKTMAGGRRALLRAWRAWCAAAGLTQIDPKITPQPSK